MLEHERVFRMDEDVTADDRVEPPDRPPPMNVGLDAFDVVHPCRGRSGFERLQGRRVDVHGSHAALASDQSGGEERDVAHAAADIHDVHARRNARAAEELLRQWIQYRGLKKEAAPFPVIVAHHVGSRV